uniref:Uncharacterized protein n=1 Tax=Rhizophora mucronata TaxID=61149 RepID=A0A2P2J1N8_RHIMU
MASISSLLTNDCHMHACLQVIAFSIQTCFICCFTKELHTNAIT